MLILFQASHRVGPDERQPLLPRWSYLNCKCAKVSILSDDLIQVINLDTHKLRQCSNFLWVMDMSLGYTYSRETCGRTKKKTRRVWLAPWSSNGIVYHVLFLFLFWYVWKELINNNIYPHSGVCSRRINNFTINRCH